MKAKYLITITIFLSSCLLPCQRKKFIEFKKNITIVYKNYSNCSKIKIYRLDNNYAIIDSSYVSHQDKSIFETNCHVSFIVSNAYWDPKLIIIPGTDIKDTIYEVVLTDPCEYSQPFLNDNRQAAEILTNINGKWYDTEVIFR